ncbi:MAG TPA: hypothetical protein VF807_06010 [Ktedonobacterales bacterium]
MGQQNASALDISLNPADNEKALPLPGWLTKVYFIFPIVLYIPDVIFNYFVYSDGLTAVNSNPIVQAGQVLLWAFLSVGVVGMAYLLSVLAPWHWGRGNHVQAIFCGFGVIIATAITTWNSLAFRSTGFHEFATDTWLYGIFPSLQSAHISLTMVLVAVAPPFWGLFWAVVQPTQGRQTLAQRQAKHAEQLLQVQHEAELKRIRAEANATVREAQLRGMAQTAVAARDQAGQLFRKKGETGEQPAVAAETESPEDRPANVVSMPSFTPSRSTERGTVVMNSMAAPTHTPRVAPAKGALVSQPSLMSDVSSGQAGRPQADVVEPMTGTTGPRPAVRRAADPSPLLRAMNEPSPAFVSAVRGAWDELSANKTKVTQKEWATAVASKLQVDEVSAKAIINRVRESERANKAAGRS